MALSKILIISLSLASYRLTLGASLNRTTTLEQRRQRSNVGRAATYACTTDDGLYRHPSDCSKFYKCAEGIGYLKTCPSGLLFNPTANVCDFPTNVDCSSGGAVTPPVVTYTTTPAYRIKEVKFDGGVAGATSFLSSYGDYWRPENGFRSQGAPNSGWHIGQNTLNPPVMIWYDFQSDGITPAEVSLQPAQSGSGLQGAPSSFQLVGSNDTPCNDDSYWTVLCENQSNLPWQSEWEVRYCKVKPEMTERFRCLGIRVLKVKRVDGSGISVRNIRMWEKSEDNPLR